MEEDSSSCGGAAPDEPSLSAAPLLRDNAEVVFVGRGLLFPLKFSADGAEKTEDAAGADAVAEATAAAAAAATAEATTVKVL
jgi:hypothetical protein